MLRSESNGDPYERERMHTEDDKDSTTSEGVIFSRRDDKPTTKPNATKTGTRTTEEQGEIEALKEKVNVAFNYMEKRAYFLQQVHRMIMFLVLLASGGLVAIVGDFAKADIESYMSGVIFIISILGLIDSFFDTSKKSYEYKMTSFKLHLLERKIRAGILTCAEIEDEHDEIIRELDFKWKKTVYAEAANEAAPEGHFYKIPFYSKPLKHLF